MSNPNPTRVPHSRNLTGYEVTDYHDGASMAADIAGTKIDCRGYEWITFGGTIDASDDPEGQLEFWGSQDGTNWTPFPLDTGTPQIRELDGTAAAGVAHPGAEDHEIDINDPDNDHVFCVVIHKPTPYMKVNYDADAGGNATGLDMGYTLDP